MNITPEHNHFLLLHKLSAKELSLFENNLKSFAIFKISDSAYLLCSELPAGELLSSLTKDLTDIELVNLVYLPNAALFSALNPDNFSGEPKTIFE